MSPTVLIVVDGARPDALREASCPHVMDLIERGSYSFSATSVKPSITLPCHTSIFHSVLPTRHGILTNDWRPMARPLPGLVEVVHAAGKRAAFFYNWENLRDLSRPGALYYSFFVNNADVRPRQHDADQRIADHAAVIIAEQQPDFAFVYLGTVDVAGHDYGWMSDEYLAQLERVDGAVGTVLSAVDNGTTVLIQSDHGGNGRTHGTESPEDMTIPWIIAGPNIRKDYEIVSQVSLLDTAPTLAHVMGLNQPFEWEGRSIQQIFNH